MLVQDATERQRGLTDNDVRRIEDKVDNVALVLAELRGSLSPTLDKLTEGQNDLEKKVDENQRVTSITLTDHETRLRAGERFRFAVPSLSALALLCAAVEALYYFTHIG